MMLIVYWVALCLGTHLPDRMAVAVTPPVSDKLLHLAAYAGLGFLLALLAARLGWRGWRTYAAALLILGVYATLDELAQIPVPGRRAELADWVADLLGVATGLGLHWLAVSVAALCGRGRAEK
ncbi:MAG: VanZ family protein [Candidatus Anammoximicrobium sp.]|nr:VanZ family protein [Candidatus Anammoximicrobium sp.]